MEITLEMENWKSLSGTFNLSPLTLLQGPNGAGKSAILQAIQFAALGLVPRYGPPAGVGQIAPEGKVRLRWGENWIRRVVEKTPTSFRVVTDCLVDGENLEKKAAEKKALEIFGADFLWADIQQFLSVKPPDRRRLILEHLPLNEEDAALWVQAKALEEVIAKWAPSVQSNRMEVAPTEAGIRGGWRVVNGLSIPPENVQEIREILESEKAVSTVIEELRVAKNAAVNERQRRQNTVETVIEVSPEMELQARSIPELVQHEQDLQAQLAKISRDREESRSILEQRRSYQAFLDNPAPGLSPELARIALASVKGELAAAVARMEAFPPPPTGGQNREARRQLQHDMEALREQGKTAVRRSKAAASGRCPIMEAPCPASELGEFAKVHKAKALEISAAFNKVKADLDALDKEQAILDEQRAKYDQERGAIEAAVATLRTKVMQAEADLAQAIKRDEEAARIKSALEALPTVAEVDEEYAETVRQQLASVRAKLAAAREAEAAISLAKRIQVDTSKVVEDFCRAVHAGAVAGHFGYLQSAIGPIQAKVNRMLAAFGFQGTLWLDLTKQRGFDLGLEVGDSHIGLAALSDGQFVMFVTALILAMPKKGLRVLTLDAGDIYHKTLPKFLRALKKAETDACIVASHVKVKAPKDWETLDMGAADADE